MCTGTTSPFFFFRNSGSMIFSSRASAPAGSLGNLGVNLHVAVQVDAMIDNVVRAVQSGVGAGPTEFKALELRYSARESDRPYEVAENGLGIFRFFATRSRTQGIDVFLGIGLERSVIDGR
jgi:hypothetical protein